MLLVSNMFSIKTWRSYLTDAKTKLYRNISFESQGAILRGRLYLPGERSKKCPVIIMPSSTTDQIPIVSTDQKGTPSALTDLTAYNWFIEYGGSEPIGKMKFHF